MAQSGEVISHWHYRAENFNTSAVEVYDAIKMELVALKIPVTFGNVEWSERGVMSASRLYLRVTSHRLNFDICAAPYGTSFFFSWWLAPKPVDLLLGCGTMLVLPLLWIVLVAAAGFLRGSLIAIALVVAGVIFLGHAIRDGASELGEMVGAMPYIGPVFDRFLRPITYYSIDTRIMFEETVHDTVLKVVEGLLVAKGAKALAPDERRLSGEGPVK